MAPVTEGEEETLHVIEGKPKEPLLLAEAEKRKELPIEPLLRITVGEDGFPRHVLVQCYCPKWDVLELTVAEYELNPDLPDSLFEFKPPPGVKVIEADPSNWK
jgi:outer membrane lipoprotein-sorting protein